MVKQTAIKKQFSITPGTYLLVKKGINSKWKPDDQWKNITIKEFIAPPPTTHSYVLHQPAEEISRGKPHTINVEIISAQEPREVRLHLSGVATGRSSRPTIEFIKTSRYGYTASIPENLINEENILNYQISVNYNEYNTVLANISREPISSPNTQMYSIRIVDDKAPICLIDVEKDRAEMRRSHRNYQFIFHSSLIPGKMGVELGTDNLIYTSFYFKEKVAGRIADLPSKKQLMLRGYALSEQPVKAWVTIQMRNGLEYGTTIALSKNQLEYTVPFDKFEQIRITGPGEKGFVFIDPFTDNVHKKALIIQEAETVKVVVLSKDNTGQKTPRIVVEYVIIH